MTWTGTNTGMGARRNFPEGANPHELTEMAIFFDATKARTKNFVILEFQIPCAHVLQIYDITMTKKCCTCIDDYFETVDLISREIFQYAFSKLRHTRTSMSDIPNLQNSVFPIQT